jgi:DNA-binding XRE family transcriptional regulator
MAKSSPDKTRRPPHPLATFRFITGLTREACGKVADLTAATIQNIELGKAPLYLENAELLEAYTGCNAVRLLEAVREWKDSKLKKRADLVTLDGQPFTAESYTAYQAAPIPAEDRERAIEDLCTRIDLMLGGLADRPHDFRAAYRRMVQFTVNERKRCGASDAELEQRGQGKAVVETRNTTLGELAKEDVISKNELYKNELSKRYKPSTKVDVSIEKFPFWPWPAKQIDFMLFLDPNLQTGECTLWRMNFPDKKQYVIRSAGIRSAKMGFTSLSQDFWREMNERRTFGQEELAKWNDVREKLGRRKSR